MPVFLNALKSMQSIIMWSSYSFAAFIHLCTYMCLCVRARVCNISATFLIHSDHGCSADRPTVSSSFSAGKKQTMLRTQHGYLSLKSHLIMAETYVSGMCSILL